jgi:Na+-transporting methylmalonyl-CoA/oxaloacetate decarboxylase gamma subunit
MNSGILSTGVEISVVGILMVFSGLGLIFFMVKLFSIFPYLANFFNRSDKQSETDPKKSDVEISDPEIIAVISAVIDIELKMKHLFYQGRFTFKQ